MTSPQPPNPPNPATAAINEETLHLPTTVPGSAARTVLPPRTAPSPYPARPAFQPPPPPPPTAPTASAPRPHPTPAPLRRPTTWEGLGFRPDIQGLRAIAVVLVLLSHAGFTFASGGYVGVDVFFVLSGFLITSLLVKEVFDTGKISLMGFYARRARRILPAATVVTIATVVGAWLWLPVTRIESAMQDAFTVIVYIVNYRFIAEETEYLNADQMPSPFQQYWSLAVEEQFYVVWPLLLIGLLILAKRKPRSLVNAAVGACAAIFAISLFLSVLVTQQSQPTAYYAAHTRVWELAAGALLALTLPTWKKTPKALAWVLGIVGLAGILAAGYLFDESTPFPGYTAMLPVLGTMLVIIAGSGPGTNPVSSLLHTKQFQFVGKISYSLYLWHWPILILIPLAIGAEPSLVLNTCLIIGTFAVAQMSFLYIEEPIRRAKSIKNTHIAGLATGVLSSVLAIAVILTFTLGFPKITEEDQKPVDLDAIEEVEDLSEIEARLAAAIETQKVPENLVPSVESAREDLPVIYDGGDDSCHLDVERTQWPEGCEFGDTSSDIVIYLVGDSHAAQWFPALEPIADRQGWKLVTRTKSSCTPVSVAIDSTQAATEYTECAQARANVFDEIDEVQPDLVVFGSSETTSLTGVDRNETGPPWLQGWQDTIERVGGAAGAMVAFADTPWADEEVPTCVDLNRDDVSACHIDEGDGIRRSDRRADTIELQNELGVTVIDPAGWLCYEGVCPVVVDDILVYRDTNHLTTPYVRSLTDLVAAELPQL
ncbi:acyltransferase family protein [Glycomyces sp. NPDC046736]|uniref:acyltransferase family protein n=1 Tax=Glycomyces sp. NPDC046736 TaxID=3155615 RepID=UPI0033E3894F